MSPKQEQEEAATEVVEVAPNILRAQLPIQMPGLGHVNMYLLIDSEGAAVIDPGLPGEETWNAIQDRLKKADLKLEDVHSVLITHSHPDHFGGAGRLRAETNCRVIGHKDFALFGRRDYSEHLEVSVEHLHRGFEYSKDAPGPQPVGDEFEDPDEVEPAWMKPDVQRPRTPWGGQQPAPNPEQMERWKKLRESGHGRFMPKLTHTVDHGSVLRLANREFFVWHTPGHTADHFCLHDPDEGVFIAGDHVLPSITPHISGLGAIADPLQAFYDSLDRVGEIDAVQRCLPAHGHPFDDLTERTEHIKQHHDERLDRLKAISKELGPASVIDFSHKLFKERSWGSMAESETYAHLEHLRLRGEAEVHENDEGLLIYVTD